MVPPAGCVQYRRFAIKCHKILDVTLLSVILALFMLLMGPSGRNNPYFTGSAYIYAYSESGFIPWFSYFKLSILFVNHIKI